MNEKYGIELELITSKFKEKVNKIKNSFQSIGKQKVDMSKQVKLDSLTRQFELASKQVESLRHKLKGLNAELASKQQWEVGTKSYVKLQNEINKTSLQLEKAGIKADTLNDKITLLENANLSKGLGQTTASFAKGLDKMTSKIKRFGLSLLSIRSIWALISRASSAYLAQDTELANKIQSVWAGLGAMLAPIIEGIANILMKAVGYINIFVKALTGVDLLARATTKSMNATAKSAKGLNKALGGFDELTNLDTGASAGDFAGGTLSGFGDVELPWADKIKSFGEWIKENKEIVIGFITGIGTALLAIKTGFAGIMALQFGTSVLAVASGIVLVFTGIGKIVEGIKAMIENPTWEAFFKIVQGIAMVVAGVAVAVGGWVAAIIAGVVAIVAYVAQHWEDVKGILGKVGNWIYENVLKPVGNFFGELGEGIKKMFSISINFIKDAFLNAVNWINIKVIQPIGNFFSGLWNGIKTTFSNVWNWILKAFSKGGQIFNGMKDGVANAFKSAVNAIIKGINKVIAIPFKTVNSLLNKIKSVDILGVKPFDGFWGWNPLAVPQIPQLAVGTNYVPEDQLAYIHKGEAVVPKKFNSQEYFGNGNDETNSLLSQVIEAINNIEINPYTTVKDVGKASLKYINGRSRQLGESVVR